MPDKPRPQTNITSFFSFFPDLGNYLRFRLRQLYIWTSLIIEFFLKISSNIKREVVKRMFWGRSTFYRQLFHLTIISITILTFFSSISQRIGGVDQEEDRGLNIAQGAIGANDMILQYANAKTFTIKETDELPFEVIEHTVQEGETLKSIAKQYKLDDVSSIQWASGMGPYDMKIFPGQILTIPPMKGVLKKVEEGDNLDTILEDVKNADKITVIELNDLNPPDYALRAGETIFIPNGDIPLPRPSSGSKKGKNTGGSYINLADPGLDVPPGTFVSPVGDSSCAGVSVSRGWASYHTGVDLAKKGGCWIRSVGEGTVIRARWGGGGLGFHVVIQHPNGFSSLYAHGTGDFAVKEGDYVNAGQKIMYMGSTGRSYGTHLHFSLSANNNNVISYGNRINPVGIVPYP
ncbi:peptidoglycan DD-metalloendopeptidase family protein [Candidatus Dojkabacteria bacterium]|nr:peptidoglycan DD-metalloendopeptidase family protein [Candidatus Dojkabacteria bacterium]